MRIVQEKLGKEYFLDVLLTKKECDLLNDYMVISQHVDVNGKDLQVGIKLELSKDEDGEDFL